MADSPSSGGDSSSGPRKATDKPGVADVLLQGNQELRASIVSNVITKGLVGLGVGVGLALFVFKRTGAPELGIYRVGKSAPVMFTTGFGLGMSYAEGSQMVRDFHEGVRRRTLIPQDPSPGAHNQTPPGL